MLSDTLTTIENQFLDSLKAVQEPTVEAARKAAELVGQLPQLPGLDAASALTDNLPTAEELVTHNFTFAQRLLDLQRDFALQLATVGTDAAKQPAKTAKKPAA